MINIEKQRLEIKLKLWETPGFSQFIEDLHIFGGPLIDIKGQIDSIKRIYEARLKKIEESESKFKQGKLRL